MAASRMIALEWFCSVVVLMRLVVSGAVLRGRPSSLSAFLRSSKEELRRGRSRSPVQADRLSLSPVPLIFPGWYPRQTEVCRRV
jgi:hypothetical protein